MDNECFDPDKGSGNIVKSRITSLFNGWGKLLVVGALALLLWFHGYDRWLDTLEARNVAIAQLLSKSLNGLISPTFFTPTQHTADYLQERPEFLTVDRTLRQWIVGVPVMEVKIVAPNGITLYATHAAHIGEDQATNTALQSSIQNHVAVSQLWQEQLISHVPILTKEGKLAAIMVVHGDISRQAGQLRDTTWQFIGLTLLGLFFSYSEIMKAIRRGESTFAQRCQEMSEIVETADQKNRQLTQEIAQKTATAREFQIIAERYRSVTESIHEAIIDVDAAGQIFFWNLGAEKVFGYSPQEAIGQPIQMLFPERNRHSLEHAFFAAMNDANIQHGSEQKVERVSLRKDGTELPVEISLTIWRGAEGSHAIAVVRDITLRWQEEAQASRAIASRIAISALLETGLESLSLERQLEIALEIILTVPWLAVQAKGAIFLMNTKKDHLVLTAHQGLNDAILTLCARVPVGHCLCGLAAQSKEIVFAEELDDRHQIRFEGIPPHGHYCIPILFENSILGVLNLYVHEHHRRDPEEDAFLVTYSNSLAGLIQRRRIEERVRHLAHHDPLTGLPNRNLFREHLERELHRARREDSRLAVMYMDLDHFKEVNDTLGHDAGDELLVLTTQRIRSCLRASDVVARMGGDEFTLLLPSLTDQKDAAIVAEKILKRIHEPYILKGNQCQIGVSIGIAIFPDHCNDVDLLTQLADAAMYDVKKSGRNGFQWATGL